MFRITIDNEEVLCDKDITIKKEMLNTPSVILNNVFPKTWESSKNYTTNFYHPNDYSKCVIADEDYIEESDGTTAEGSNLSINYDDRRNFEYNLKGDTYQYTTTGKNLFNKGNDLTGVSANSNNSTMTKSKDNISFTTTNTRYAGFYIPSGTFTSYIDNFSSSKTYTVSADITTSANVEIQFGFESGRTTRTFNGKQRMSCTSTSNSIASSFIVYAMANGITVKVENIQVEEGSSMTSYETYTNGASPNPDYPQNIEVVTGEQDINICGKNLLKYPYKNTTQTISDVTFADNGNGSITVNGTNSSSSQVIWYISENKWTYNDLITYELEPGTYTFKGIGTDKVTMHVNMFKSDDTNEYFSIQISSVTKTITEKVRLNIRLGVYGNQTVNNYTIYPMIEKSNQSSTYEAYKGNTYEINLGKNLFDGIIEQGNYDGSTGAKTGSNAFYRNANKIPVQPSTTYTFSLNGESKRYVVLFYKGDGTFISQNSSLTTGTFTTPSNAYYVNFRCFQSDYTDNYATLKIMLEKGSVATSYSPYRSYTKNLFDKNSITSGYRLDGSGNANGSASNEFTSNFIPVESGATYIRNYGSITAYTRTCFYDENRVFISKDDENQSVVVPSNAKYLRFCDYLSRLDTMQFEKGNQVTSYVPYMSQIELCKIGNYQDYIKKSTGKNLFKIMPISTGNYNNINYLVNTTENSITINGGASNSSNFIRLQNYEANKSYTVSYNFTQTTNRLLVRLRKEDDSGWLTNSDITFSGWNYNTTYGAWWKDFSTGNSPIMNFDIPSALYWQLGFVNVGTNQNTYYNIQLLEGTYTSQTIPQYEPYGTGWYICKNIEKRLLNGSENWTYQSDYLRFYTINTPIAKNLSLGFSNYYKVDTNVNSNNKISFATGTGYNNLLLRDERFTTTADFKTWLSTHNTTVYYVLNTPTYIGIEDEELISQLEDIRLLNGLNNIITSSPYLPAIMNLHYNFNEAYYYMNQLFFSGVVKNSGNISLNPREPHFQTLQILDFKTFLSEGETLDRVIVNKTILETIQEVVGVISGYGFVLGNVQIANPNDIIGAYSTENKTAYDIFNYIAEITQSKWTTRLIDENTVAIDFYGPSALPQGTPIEYNTTYFKDNLIDNMFYSYSSNDYRNKQIMTSKEVFANIDTKETIISSGYGNTFLVEQPIGQIESIKLNNVEMSFATKQDKELGYSADFYYSVGSNSIESDINIPLGSSIVIQYIPIVSGRQVISNDNEISRISGSTGRNGIITRYENRNDASTSTELQMIGQSYIKYKGSPEIKLTVETRSNLWEIGERVQFNAPIPELATEYMVKSKKIQYIPTIDEIFYTFEMSSSFNSEQDINYFDNQRAKAQGNIKEGSYISRNIDIENVANITFQNVSIEKINSTGDNKLNSTLNSPIVQ